MILSTSRPGDPSTRRLGGDAGHARVGRNGQARRVRGGGWRHSLRKLLCRAPDGARERQHCEVCLRGVPMYFHDRRSHWHVSLVAHTSGSNIYYLTII